MKLRCNQDARNLKINRIWNVGLGKLQIEREDREEGRKKMGGNCRLSNCKAAGVGLSKYNEPLLYHYEPGSQIRIYKILAFAHLGFSLTLVPPTF